MIERNFSKCPRCGCDTVKSKTVSTADSEFWLECTSCNTFINTYIPLEHQEDFHTDAHKFKGNFGGYGTGKTTTSREEFYKHMFITPNGNTLIGANVQSQYEQTIKRDIESDLPIAFVTNTNAQKQYIDFINGHRLMFRPFDDQGKLRSYNITMFVIVEASEVNAEIFHQLKTRLRNVAATVPDRDVNGNIRYTTTNRGVQIPVLKYDWREGVIESNPDSGWIRTDILLVSSQITKHGSVPDTHAVMASDEDPATSCHIAASDANVFLPPTFIRDNCKNKPPWWIARYIKGSFSYAEGLVYPNAMKCVKPTEDIPKDWKRVIAFDYGLSDVASYILGAIDEQKGLLHIYKEVRTNDKNVEELAQLYFQAIADVPSGGIWGQPIIDPKSGPKRDYDKKSLGDHFLEYGISFKPGQISIDARVFRLNTYIESGKLIIHDCCIELIKELREYKYPPKQIGKTVSDKPQDKNNHSINPLEWIVMELPADPAKILYGIYNKLGQDITKTSREDKYRDPFDDASYYKEDAEMAYGIDNNYC